MKYVLLGLAMIILAGASFFAGVHWKKYEIKAQLTRALGTSLVCVANSVEDKVNVASLLDEKDSNTAKAILVAGIKSGDTKLKLLGVDLNRNDQALVNGALQDGEAYLKTNHPL